MFLYTADKNAENQNLGMLHEFLDAFLAVMLRFLGVLGWMRGLAPPFCTKGGAEFRQLVYEQGRPPVSARSPALDKGPRHPYNGYC